MAKNKKLDVIGAWSEAKLDIVREYAAAYSKILAKQSGIIRHIYIDAFAGAGLHVSKETEEYVLGSPLNALKITPSFSEFHFIDMDEERVEKFQSLADTRNDITVHHGDCNKVLLQKVFPRCQYKDYARALCLLDPPRPMLWELR